MYPARKQFVSRQRSTPSALPIYRRRFSPSGMPEGVAPSAFFRRRGVYPARKQFVSRLRSMPSALPIYRRRSSSSGMPEGAAAPSPFFRRRGRVPRRGAIFCLSGRNDLLSSSISSVPKTSAEGKSLLIYRRRFSSSGDAGRGRRPFRFLPQAGACTPPRSDFLFVRTQRLAVLFSSIRSENLCRRKIASDT